MVISIAGSCVTFLAGPRIAPSDLDRVKHVLATFMPFESAVVDLSHVAECDRERMRALAREMERIPLVRYRFGAPPGRRRRFARYLREGPASAGAEGA